MRQVLDVSPLPGCKLAVRFTDGSSGVFDVSPYIRSPFFEQLRDDAYFQQVRTFHGGVSWPDGQDLGPDTIAEHLRPAPAPG